MKKILMSTLIISGVLASSAALANYGGVKKLDVVDNSPSVPVKTVYTVDAKPTNFKTLTSNPAITMPNSTTHIGVGTENFKLTEEIYQPFGATQPLVCSGYWSMNTLGELNFHFTQINTSNVTTTCTPVMDKAAGTYSLVISDKPFNK